MRGASCAILALRAAAAVPSLDPATYLEPSVEEYWTGDSAAARPFREERLNASHLEVASFSERISSGKVFVVEDLGDGPMAKWDCAFFTKDPVFKEADVQMEYIKSVDASFVPLDDGEWQQTLVSTGVGVDEEAPKYAPFYFGVKNPAKDDFKTWKASMLKKVQKYVTLPPFMPKSNLDDMRGSPEFWFAAAGAGAKGHMDSHIETTMTLQIAGTKRWRLGLIEPRKTAFLADLYRDGDVYGQFGKGGRWRPLFNVTLRPGQAMFFPPGFIHETMNTGEGAPCSASVTFQFGVPLAAKMFRTFLPRVRRTADIHSIWSRLRAWATLYGHKPGSVGMNYTDAKAEALSNKGMGELFRKIDEDADGRLSGEELKKRFHYADEGTPGEDKNILAFQDLDEDGFITREEFAEVFGFWAGTVHKVLQETPKKYHKLQLQEHAMLDEVPDELYKKLRKHGLALEAGTCSLEAGKCSAQL